MTLEGLNDDFRDIVVVFADCGVDFVVVGAYALAFHGAPRASGDIDLFVRASPENAVRVMKALGEFGAPLEISGVTFDEVWASRVPADVDARRIHIIGREAFLKNKAAAGRPKDLADVARLKKLPDPER